VEFFGPNSVGKKPHTLLFPFSSSEWVRPGLLQWLGPLLGDRVLQQRSLGSSSAAGKSGKQQNACPAQRPFTGEGRATAAPPAALLSLP